ncbi:MAG: enoyl-CoA hydratase/isomerase family protein [Deltaproteobacteria bacterium]|nr:enoyl-CoA hydratase/isomerase family protein [Deltaproteobacteria bacterium]
MGDYRYIEYEVRDAVALLRWNRPDARNALLPEMTDEAGEALSRAASDADVRAVVLTGAGEAFSAGADLKALGQSDRLGRSAIVGHERGRHGTARTKQLLELPKPTIAAVHGAVAGMSCAWALACDVIVASRDARFHFGFVRVGFVTDCGTSWLLVRRVGIGQAKRLALTGDPVDGAEALRIGLCDELVDGGTDVERALALGKRIAEQPPLAVQNVKRVLEFAGRASFDDAAELEAWTQGALGETADHQEAVRAFVEKRTPRFSGS